MASENFIEEALYDVHLHWSVGSSVLYCCFRPYLDSSTACTIAIYHTLQTWLL